MRLVCEDIDLDADLATVRPFEIEFGVELPRAHLRLIALDVTHGRTLTHAPGYYFKVAEWTPLAVFDQERIRQGSGRRIFGFWRSQNWLQQIWLHQGRRIDYNGIRYINYHHG